MGGHQPRRGVPTPEVATFRKICMSKRKNLDLWGARTGGAPSIRHWIGRQYATLFPLKAPIVVPFVVCTAGYQERLDTAGNCKFCQIGI